jgi:acetylornithine deacetylase/succinyl-diaminopimelate desuccinylase-like protein
MVEAMGEELVATCLAWGNLPDTAGHELPVAEAVASAYTAAGFDTRLQHLGAESANVIGVLRADEPGMVSRTSLILNSHLDTEGDIPDAPEKERRRLRGTSREGDLLIGKGLVNATAHLAAQLMAVRALGQAGVG